MPINRYALWAGLLLGAFVAQAQTGTIQGILDYQGLTKGETLVVYLEEVPGGPFPQPKQLPVLDQKNKTYIPHVLATVAGWEVRILNSDGIFHNVHALMGKTTLFNLAMPPMLKEIKKKFTKTGVVRMVCDVHPEMLAWVVVLQNPYFAIVPDPKMAKRGAPKTSKVPFLIRNVPPGEYTLRVWGEFLKKPQLEKKYPVTVTAGAPVRVTLAP